jgi:myo-inositol-1(or 4)-monophosphatase
MDEHRTPLAAPPVLRDATGWHPTHGEVLETAIAAAGAGAQVLRRYFAGGLALDAVRKGEHDFVTRADHESEMAILGEIRRRHPDHGIVAEESGRTTSGRSDCVWYVDPLDGTTNFLHGLPIFCISVACRQGDEMVAGVVYDPLRRDLFTATRGGGARWNGKPMAVSTHPTLTEAYLATGYPWRARAALDQYLAAFRDLFLEAKSIRRCGAAALDLAHTAAGIYDGFFEFRLSPWDIAAGVLLVEEAGGWVTDLDGGNSFLRGGNVIAAGPVLQRQLCATVARHADEAALDRLVPVTHGELLPLAAR